MQNMTRDYYRALYEVSKTVNSRLKVDEVLNSFVKGITEAMGAKGCALMLLSPDKKQLHHRAAHGLSKEYMKKGTVHVDSSMSEALKGQVVAVPNAPEDQRVEYPEEARKEGIASIMSVPMLLRDNIIGVIRIYTQEQRQFSMDDMYFAGAIANLASIAMENAQLYEDAQKSFDTLRRELVELADRLTPASAQSRS